MSEHRHIGPLFSAEEENCLTHAQMLDYAGGKLTSAEKHHVERHLLNCELCALAFEGIAEEDAETVAAGAEAIVAEAWTRVAALNRKRRRSAFVWMSSAAAILLLMLVGFFVIDQQQEKQMSELADSMFELPEAPLEEGEALEERNLEDGKSSAEMTYAEASPEQEPRMEEALKEEKPLDAPAPPAEVYSLDAMSETDEIPMEDFDMEAEEVVVLAPTKGNTEQVLGVGSSTDAEWGATVDKPTYSSTGSTRPKAPTSISLSSTPNNQGSTTANTIRVDSIGLQSDFRFADVEENMSDQDAWTSGGEMDDFVLEEKDGVVAANDSRGRNEFAVSKSVSEPRLESGDFSGKSTSSGLKRKDKNEVSDAVATAPSRAQEELQKEYKPGEERLSNKTDYYRRGLEAYENQDYAKGARYLRQAATDLPQNLQAHLYAAFCFIELDQFTAAQFHLDRILAQRPNSLETDALWYKSIVLLKMGKKKEAEAILKELQQKAGPRQKQVDDALERF